MTQELYTVSFLNYLPVDYTLTGRDKGTPRLPPPLEVAQLTGQPQADSQTAQAVPCLEGSFLSNTRAAASASVLRQTYASLLQSSGGPARSVASQTGDFPPSRLEDAIPPANKRRRLSPSRDSEARYSGVHSSCGASLQGRHGHAWLESAPAVLRGAQLPQQLPLPAPMPGAAARSAAQHVSGRVFCAPLPRPVRFSAGRGQNQTLGCSSDGDGQASAAQQRGTAAFDLSAALRTTQSSRLPHVVLPVGRPTRPAPPPPSDFEAKPGSQACSRSEPPQIAKVDRFTQLASLHLLGQLAGSGSSWDSNRDVTISALRMQQKRLLLERHRTLAELQQLSKAYCKEEGHRAEVGVFDSRKREIAVAEGPIREESAQAQESRLSSLMESLQRFQQEPNPGPDCESQQQCTVIEIRKLLKDSRSEAHAPLTHHTEKPPVS